MFKRKKMFVNYFPFKNKSLFNMLQSVRNFILNVEKSQKNTIKVILCVCIILLDTKFFARLSNIDEMSMSFYINLRVIQVRSRE